MEGEIKIGDKVIFSVYNDFFNCRKQDLTKSTDGIVKDLKWNLARVLFNDDCLEWIPLKNLQKTEPK